MNNDERRHQQYEGLFLFPQAATAELKTTIDHVQEVLSRAEAELLALARWDERRLAYDIKGNKRGLYILAYFLAPTDRLADLERDCNLSERILRAMIIRADHLTEEQMRNADNRQALHDEAALRDQEAEASEEQAEPVETAET